MSDTLRETIQEEVLPLLEKANDRLETLYSTCLSQGNHLEVPVRGIMAQVDVARQKLGAEMAAFTFDNQS